MPDIENFTLLCAGYFYIPINILELCLGLWLNYLEIVWSFMFLLFKLVLGMTQSMFSSGLIFPYYWGKTLLNTTQCPLNYKVFYSGWCKEASYLALCEVWVLFLLILLGSFFFIRGSFSCMHVIITHSTEYSKKTLCRSPECSLRALPSFPVLFCENSSYLGFPRLLALRPLLWETTGLSLSGFLLSVPQPGSVFQGEKGYS